MEEWITQALDKLAFWIVGIYAVSESLKKLLGNADFFHEWLKKRGIKTKKMIEREKEKERLNNIEAAIAEIKDTAKSNVNMFLEHEKQVVAQFANSQTEIVNGLNRLHDKIDEQQKRLEEIDRDGRQRDCAVLRDRIRGGMRYFSQNVDEKGRVHISMSDHETMQSLYEEYFLAGGNGTFKQKYENEFKKFIIDDK